MVPSFRVFSLGASLTLLVLAGDLRPAAAQHFDMLWAQQGGKLVSLGFDDTFLDYSAGVQRVFEADLDPTEPGVQSQTQAELTAAYPGPTFLALPAGQDLAFNLMPFTANANVSNLFYWAGGGGPVNFQPVVGNSLTLTHPTSFESVTVSGANAAEPGFDIGTTDGNGVVHRHLGSSLATATDGFYLIAAEFQMAGLANSDPTYLVFGAGAVDEDDHEAAVDWAIANLLGEGSGPGSNAVPEPSAWLMMALGACGLGWRCRRRA